ncbi:MAG: MvaI/BcnI family restriction endonuclease, partial [Flavobacteriaceae bacterium]|nr:MvaI/BcnI family restriction endonuclease [Flavobacteriaceae bacterium]
MSDHILQSPPKNKNELFSRLRDVIAQGWTTMPNHKRYTGSGAPGNFLEDLLGLRAGNLDVPDTIGWELKYYTKETNLITLFHKEPKPEKIMRYMVRQFGWKDQKDRLSFRHTIKGKSDRFKVDINDAQITVRPGQVYEWRDFMRTHSHIKGKGLSNTSRNNAVKDMRTLFNYAIKREWADLTNPFEKIPRLKQAEAVSRVLTVEESKHLLEVAETYSTNAVLIFYLGRYAGLRIKEIVNAKANWFDFKKNTICTKKYSKVGITYFQTKNKKERVLPIHDKLKAVLKKNMPKSGYLIEPDNPPLEKGYRFWY